ncbi:non-ribosomal peptide synthetase [Flavobacteriales bacterium ALC-1]|nr:non-ribosomal peptide synthetase [Flavobacteriales bacterium ALC-1]
MDLTKKKALKLLEEFNNTRVEFPSGKTIVDLFLKQVDAAPNSLAVIFRNKELSYTELDVISNRFSNYLTSNHKLKEADFVGLMIERSEWLIIVILGILKAGAVYVPIDLESPQSRKDYIQKDSNCKITIDASIIDDFKSKIEDYSDDISFKVNSNPNDLAYIIYTSGTTGKPKGVMIEHRSVVNLIFSQTKDFKIDMSDKILQFSNYFFDASVEQIFLALFNGATLCVISKEELKDHLLTSFIKKHKITHLHATPSYLATLPDLSKFNSLKRIIAGGETCTLKLAERMGAHCDFYNEYGPTETTVTSTIYKYSKKHQNDISLPIGKPIANTKAYILSESLKQLPIDEVGELCLSGDSLARGYLNQEELTSEKFIANPFEPNEKLYRTGDFAKWNKNGTLEFIGRKDDQVKVRGYRIELGEVEAALNSLPNIKQALAIASGSLANGKKLIAYVQTNELNTDAKTYNEQLLKILPEYMIPSKYVLIEEFPMTANGKIDKKNLPNPLNKRPDNAPVLRKYRNKNEKAIVEIWRAQLDISEIGIDDNFFEMGGNSLLTQKVAVLITQILNIDIPVTKIYQYPTIAKLSEHIEIEFNKPKDKSIKSKKSKTSVGDIAIIGMAGRFPGASTIEGLWDILKEGKETISFFTPDELDESLPESLRNDPLYIGARGIITTAKQFDAKFFGLNPKLAQAMDPQQRLFLEIAWEVLEQSGHLPKHYDGSVGVYAGVNTNTYYVKNVVPNTQLIAQIGAFQANTVNDKDFIASRTSYHLNLKGPAVSVHSACSTSLLAIAEAVEAIRSGQCDVAIAGGASVTSPVNSGHLYQEGSMLSANGHCRSFDAEGKGTVFSDGAGVILLKSLEDAKKNGDIIHGVIKGIGINNDGGNKGSFTAPSVEGQSGAIRSALMDANIKPSEITYIEAHGTATPIGDPIEIEGLNAAFGNQDVNGYCAIGSIKSNIGHLTAAAGVAGVIKTVLAMKHRQIPPSLGFENPNPSIDFENSPFFVNNKLNAWESEGLRKAGVSSFGVGGTNVHVVVEEYETEKITSDAGRSVELLTWSAKTQNSLDGYQRVLGDYLKSPTGFSLTDVAYALTATRESFAQRSFVIAGENNEASKKLLSENKKAIKTNVLKVVPSELTFLFPGQGSQYLQMGKSLYEEEKVFKDAVDHCAELLKKDLNLDIRTVIYPEINSEEAENQLKDTKFTQPGLFVIEYALSQLWMSWGIKPTLLCGHSIGEFVAAHLAGILTLKDALHLIAIRGKLVSELPGGSMLSVRASVANLNGSIPDALSIAAINSDRLTVLSGPDIDIGNFSKVLNDKGLPNMLLLTSHAFHSTMMDPVLQAFEDEVKKIKLNVPRLPIVSTVTGKWLSDAEAKSSKYWTNHLREAVNFSGAMETVLGLEDPILLEIGPGRALITLSMQKKGLKPLASIACLSIPKENETAHHTVLSALGDLWINGIEPNWKSFYEGQTRQKVWLPSYVFDRKPCWLDPPTVDLSVNNITKKIVNADNQRIKPIPNINTKFVRKPIILNKISEIIEDNSGIEIETNESHLSFLELGLDSLVLTQLAINLKNEFNTPITFRQLNGEFETPDLLAEYLDKVLPKVTHTPVLNTDNAKISNTNDLSITSIVASTELLSEAEKKEHQKPFGASPKIEKESTKLSSDQKTFLDNLILSYNKKTAGSKDYSQKHRKHMSDPRVVSGFNPLTKELVYPLVVGKSSGNRLWDIDGNEYIDTLNGFGSCLFGHQPDFIKETLHKQVELGFEVGPQHPLAGEVCELLCDFTGHERAALCNTGSEAVLGAMRIARTVTGRSLIVAFSRSYHGINDEVIVRGSKKLKTFPAASGILPEAVQNMLILDYGTEESLAIIKERSHEIAAVLVEPVQSRRPEFVPIKFLKEVREITRASDTILIFDEIITGFRMHLGGAQALFGIKADVATYGKVIGGGISIGAIMGNKNCMDALDGGFWQYGDDSFPEVGVTYFAGTFVRHPLALATTKASLLHMKTQGEKLQDDLAKQTERLASELTIYFKTKNLPLEIAYYRSLWRLKILEEIPYSELFFVLMRKKGIHIWDGFPCYMTAAYTEEDLTLLINTFIECIEELIAVRIFKSELNADSIVYGTKKFTKELNQPPLPGAQLGFDAKGNPAWFITDKEKNDEYIQIDL